MRKKNWDSMEDYQKEVIKGHQRTIKRHAAIIQGWIDNDGLEPKFLSTEYLLEMVNSHSGSTVSQEEVDTFLAERER